MSVSEERSSGSLAGAISTAIVRQFSEFVGRGPTRARTTIVEDTVTVVVRDMLTKAERKLIADGQSDTVLLLRVKFQQSMRADLIAAVEMLTERKVLAFMSGNDLEADAAAEVFLLEPALASV
jgi:uncharacterized protein YbcI